ncbi:hypothetical protein DF185_19820 [Marinifilum breve]|uniref:Uncharacterized protein n=1 Tax=Marinifilum breve TaxID=2184082 RepID=A0A2V4A683_9BACT|nr:hypothetical protein [Marinifilum breve]PXX96890.1 hypothetical protein DF185_19820 [Marinifilum breve]
MDLPKKYQDLVGTKQKCSGSLFSYKNEIKEPLEFDVLDIRKGTATIMDMKTMEECHPTFELLLKREGMKKAQWTKPFPIREIDLREKEMDPDKPDIVAEEGLEVIVKELGVKAIITEVFETSLIMYECIEVKDDCTGGACRDVGLTGINGENIKHPRRVLAETFKKDLNDRNEA